MSAVSLLKRAENSANINDHQSINGSLDYSIQDSVYSIQDSVYSIQDSVS